MQDLFITAVVFFGFYHIIRLISEHFLKRKLINNGHSEQAGILVPPPAPEEANKYPSLKWGLVAFMAGLGLIIIEFIRAGQEAQEFYQSMLPYGIELVFISLGFLVYFFIVNRRVKA